MTYHIPIDVSFDSLMQHQFNYMQHEYERISQLFIQKRKEVASFLSLIHDQQTEVTVNECRKDFQETLRRQESSLALMLKNLDEDVGRCHIAYEKNRWAFLKQLTVRMSADTLLELITYSHDADSNYPIYNYT